MSEELKVENKIVSTSDQEGVLDLKKEKPTFENASDVAKEIDRISGDQDIDPLRKAEEIYELTQLLKQKQEEWMNMSGEQRKLAKIEEKIKANKDLDRDDLRFLYQIDSRIREFGTFDWDRKKAILSERNKIKDISMAIGCTKDEVGLKKKTKTLHGGIKYHFGDLGLYELRNMSTLKGIKLPDYVSGNLSLDITILNEELELPKHVGEHLSLCALISAKNLKLPNFVGGCLNLRMLRSAEGLVLPDYVGYDINLDSLTSAKGLKIPDNFEGRLSLDGLISSEGLELPKNGMRGVSLKNVPKSEKDELRKKYPNHNIV